MVNGPRSRDHRDHRELTMTIYFLMGSSLMLAGGGPAQMSGRWLIPAAGYYGVPTGKNGVAKMASLRLRIGAQITRKYAHNLLIDLYKFNFYGKQH